MSFLDLYQGDQEQASRIQPNEGHDLPSGFGENFHAAWSDGRLFSQSIAQLNARGAALDDYVDEVKSKTGFDLKNDLAPKEGGGPIDYDAVNFKIAALNQQNPNLKIAPLTDDEIDKRALTKAQAAHRNYEALQARERTAGGAFGSFVGSAASSAADPINIAGLAIAPETAGIGILSAALRWGAVAGVSQATIEFASDDFKNQVQPGYTESGEPLREIGGAFVGGAALGGITKALGSAWTKVKTGNWTTSVRDAGNVIESEAHTASTNPLPGAEGEVAHREALVKSIDDILAGRPIDVGQQVTPELAKAAADAERAKIVPEPPSGLPPEQLALPLVAREARELHLLHGYSADAGFSGFKPLDKVSDEARYDGGNGVFGKGTYLDATGKWINGDNGPLGIDAAVRVKASFNKLFVLTPDSVAELDSIIGQDAIGNGGAIAEALKAKGYDGIHVSGFDDLPSNSQSGPWSADSKIDPSALQDQVVSFAPDKNLNVFGKVNLPERPRNAAPGEADTYFQRRRSAIDAEGDFLAGPARPKSRAEGPQSVMHTPEQISETLNAPNHQDVIRGDIDRAIDANAAEGKADIKVPGVDEMGNHTMVSVHAAVDEVDAYKKLATDIQACATMTEAAE